MQTAVPYPIFLNLKDRPILIVGGGPVAVRKANALIPTGAAITILAPQIASELSHLPGITLRHQTYTSQTLPGSPRFSLVFAATNLPEVNAAVARDAAAAGIFCTRADAPDDGDFSNGAVHHQSGLTFAVSTRGASPAMAARIRDEMLAHLNPNLPLWSDLFTHWRKNVLAHVQDPAERRDLLLKLAGPDIESALQMSGTAKANELAARWISAAASYRDGATGS